MFAERAASSSLELLGLPHSRVEGIPALLPPQTAAVPPSVPLRASPARESCRRVGSAQAARAVRACRATLAGQAMPPLDGSALIGASWTVSTPARRPHDSGNAPLGQALCLQSKAGTARFDVEAQEVSSSTLQVRDEVRVHRTVFKGTTDARCRSSLTIVRRCLPPICGCFRGSTLAAWAARQTAGRPNSACILNVFAQVSSSRSLANRSLKGMVCLEVNPFLAHQYERSRQSV